MRQAVIDDRSDERAFDFELAMSVGSDVAEGVRHGRGGRPQKDVASVKIAVAKIELFAPHG